VRQSGPAPFFLSAFFLLRYQEKHYAPVRARGSSSVPFVARPSATARMSAGAQLNTLVVVGEKYLLQGRVGRCKVRPVNKAFAILQLWPGIHARYEGGRPDRKTNEAADTQRIS
jgi:hypothetical protein